MSLFMTRFSSLERKKSRVRDRRAKCVVSYFNFLASQMIVTEIESHPCILCILLLSPPPPTPPPTPTTKKKKNKG
jgi:hypothetical protein